MGRKQKLRQNRKAKEKKDQQLALALATSTGQGQGTTSVSASASASASATSYPTGIKMTYDELTTGDTRVNSIIVELAGVEFSDLEFPKSDSYANNSMKDVMDSGMVDAYNTFSHAAVEYGCVHSMFGVGMICSQLGAPPHLVQPWLIEGAIRGSLRCIVNLMTRVYNEAKPHHAQALAKYWMQILAKHDDSIAEHKSKLKYFSDGINRECAICQKIDTDTLTLRQCIGCSAYCYCGEVCQTTHWVASHKGECKQLRILNKYHKAHATEIRDASIRGVIEIPILEKLRDKLGLTRPKEEYQELCISNIYEGKTIDPYNHVVARDDGTVWVGSYEQRMGPSEPTFFTNISLKGKVVYAVVPPNFNPGDKVIVHTPDGIKIPVIVPKGCVPGSKFLVKGPPSGDDDG